ncbi:MAG: HPr family phosphocarrier protein [Gammaproteobacteria bacterium]|nr:HPr family phosphocarrier protein [Gammaproteobacteria bacterium]
MQQQSIEIINKLGLHARAAAKFVTLAQTFAADIQVQSNNRKVNGKSIMGMMMLAAAKGTQIELIIEGEDESIAMQQLIALINNRFDENE